MNELPNIILSSIHLENTILSDETGIQIICLPFQRKIQTRLTKVRAGWLCFEWAVKKTARRLFVPFKGEVGKVVVCT